MSAISPISAKTTPHCAAGVKHAKKTEAAPLRVLVADDDPLVRAAVRLMLSSDKGSFTVEEATDGENAMELARTMKPDVLLLDLAMPKKAGLEALRELGESIPHMRTILLTLAVEKRQIVEALQLGARGVVLKETAREVLTKSIQAVMNGHYWIDREAVTDARQIVRELMAATVSHANPKRALLTEKEMVIIGYIVEGCTNRDIARTTGVSEQVVKNNLGRIFDKLGVFNRLELALYALDNQLVVRH